MDRCERDRPVVRAEHPDGALADRDGRRRGTGRVAIRHLRRARVDHREGVLGPERERFTVATREQDAREDRGDDRERGDRCAGPSPGRVRGSQRRSPVGVGGFPRIGGNARGKPSASS